MSSKLRAAIIGDGGIAGGKHGPGLAMFNPLVEVVALCDIDSGHTASFLKKGKTAWDSYQRGTSDDVAPDGSDATYKGGYDFTGAKTYLDYRKMLEVEDIDIVHVCTPNSSHAEIAIAAMERGIHVMCEKPMAHRAVDAYRMYQVAQETGKLLNIGYQNRFRKDSQIIKQVIERGDLGKIYFGEALALRRRAVPDWGSFLNEELQGGGPVIDILTHAMDLTLWLMDDYEPTTVSGTIYHELNGTENAANAWGSWKPENFKVEDCGFGFIRTAKGATIIGKASWAINLREDGEAQCALAGNQGGMDMKNGLWVNDETLGVMRVTEYQPYPRGVAFFDPTPENPTKAEFACWLGAVQSKNELLVKPEQALVVSEVLEGIYMSARLGREVTMEEVRSQYMAAV